MPSAHTKYLALLRGINVGGNNIITKQELIDCFEDLGFGNVRTYIQSGNILFRSRSKSIQAITKKIEAELSTRFSYTAHAVVLSYAQYQAALQSAPKQWGSDDAQKHNALFVMHDADPKKLVQKLSASPTKYDVVHAGKGVIFWSISKKHQMKTAYMELSKDPMYKEVTIRNSNTAFALLELFEQI